MHRLNKAMKAEAADEDVQHRAAMARVAPQLKPPDRRPNTASQGIPFSRVLLLTRKIRSGKPATTLESLNPCTQSFCNSILQFTGSATGSRLS